MIFPQAETIVVNGIEMAVYEAKPEAGSAKNVPPIIMCHGFPELAFSWRHQLPALAGAGYHAIAPDQRGYGGTSAPKGISAYHAKELAADLVGLLDAKGIEKAIFCGHDWGSLVMWALPFYAPERLAGLISLNVPFLARRGMDPITMMNARFGEENYINFFQTPDAPEKLFEADVEKAFRFFMRKANYGFVGEDAPRPMKTPNVALQQLFKIDEAKWPGEVLLDDEELAYFTEKFSKSGFNGPINWYRNFVANWQDMERYQPEGETPNINIPTLMILAENDPVLPPALAEGMDTYCTDLTTHLIKNCGHWTQQEHPDEVNEVMLKWLQDNFSSTNAGTKQS